VRVTTICPPRGNIFARNGEVLVDNRPSFDLTLIPQDTPDSATVLEKISFLLEEDKNVFENKLLKKKKRPPFEPVTLKQELAWNQMSLVLANRVDLHGISINVVAKRHYCLGTAAGHLLGYLGEIDIGELKKAKFNNYSLGNLIGKDGVEKWAETYLKGQPGGLQTEVDARGHLKKILAEIEPVAGSNVYLSLDAKAQTIAEKMLQNKTGAVVAMDPHNGDILVMTSSPCFDPNLLSRGIDAKDWQALITNDQHPLLNRALQSQQPPGSVFKIFVAIAALENKVIDPNKKLFCPGHFRLGNRVFHCWKEGGHGWVDMQRAIIESCDVYFYQIGLQLGIETISKYAKMLGLGEETGFEIKKEKKGLVPSSDWKEKMYGIPWQKGETLNTSIGQGFLLTTPIQIAASFCGIVNGGMIPKPRTVLKIEGKDDTLFLQPKTRKMFSLSEETFAIIKNALVGVVNDPKGTGASSKIESVLVAGKTGTAQTLSRVLTKEDESITKYQDHAWFVAFAPADDPKIVVAVLVEHGGHGGSTAAPIAREVIKSYLNL
jgi:penicillin-binding protein 2